MVVDDLIFRSMLGYTYSRYLCTCALGYALGRRPLGKVMEMYYMCNMCVSA